MTAAAFIKRIPLSVKTAFSMLLVVTVTMALVQWFESRHLKDIFIAYQLDMHEKSAQEQLYRFVDHLREQKNSVKALATQNNLNNHLQRLEKEGWAEQNNGETVFHNSPPDWFPATSVTRAFYHNTYAILMDPRGRVREVYKDLERPLSPYLLRPELILPRLINTDGIITYVEKDPFQIVIQRVYGPAKKTRAILMFAFPIDTHFIRKSEGAILGANELALLDKDNRVMASSNPDIIPKGTTNDLLGREYYLSKKTFFSYGETEIEMMFVSLMPKKTIDSLTRKVLALELEHGLIYAVAFILSSTLVVFFLSGRIKGLTRETVDFIQHNLGRRYKTPPVGDEMATLETSFHQMKEEIITYQNSLAAEKERLAVTLSSIGDAVIATDTKGTVLLINKVAEDLTGWPQDGAVGKSLPEVFHIINEKTRLRCENPVEKVLATGLIIGLANHTALISRDGTERVISDSGAPIRDREGRIIGTVLVFRDITEKQKIEEELLNAKKLESVAILAAGIAHEINNPLTNASLNLQLIKGGLEGKITDMEILQRLEAVERNMDRASVIAKNLLQFSRHKEFEFMPFKVGRIITDVLMLIEYKLNNIRIHQELSETRDILGDPVKMEQVFINILNNSIEAMPQGGDIFMSASDNNGFVEVKISDTGGGIHEDFVAKVFDPFFTTKEIGVGTGLGLAICYGIINQHKGLMEIKSTLGKGTEVCIKLPVNESLNK